MKKYTVASIMVLLILLVSAFPVYAAIPAPRVSVYYTQNSNSVDVTLTWDDYGGETEYHAYWAESMLSDSSELDYHNIDSSITITNNRLTVTKTGLIKFKNYFFKIESSSQPTAYVRVYPNNIGSGRLSNESAHGNFTENTPMCGVCHTSHASLKAQLLNETTYYQLCKLCHGTASTQSKYDVEGGKIQVEGGLTVPSLAGPFVDGVTSKHLSDDSVDGWGPVSVPGTDSGITLSLTCLSCHTSHGKADDNYRLLRKTIYVDDAKTDSLKTVNLDYKAYAITSDANSGEELFMARGNTEFCSACHMNYDDGSAQAPGRDSRLTTSQAVYRHPVTTVNGAIYSVFTPEDLSPSKWGPLPLQYNASESTDVTDKRTAVVCSTCHFAHGTTKQFDTDSGTNKYILRLDNYGVCESCHKK